MSARPAFSGEPQWEHPGPVLFIAEVQNRLEKRLIEQCLDQAEKDSRSGSMDRVILKFSGGKNSSGLEELAAKL